MGFFLLPLQINDYACKTFFYTYKVNKQKKPLVPLREMVNCFSWLYIQAFPFIHNLVNLPRGERADCKEGLTFIAYFLTNKTKSIVVKSLQFKTDLNWYIF